MLGCLVLAYMAYGYYFFWRTLREVPPARLETAVIPLVSLLIGPLVTFYALVRIAVDPHYRRPMRVTFVEFDYDPQTREFIYQGEHHGLLPAANDD